MATVNDVTNSAYRIIGIDNPTDTDNSRALQILNDMIALWSIQDIMLPFLTEESFPLSVGVYQYTIGPGANFDTDRPTGIRYANTVDLTDQTEDPVNPNMSRQEFNEVRLKSAKGRPERLLYDTQYVNGIINLDPSPDKTYTLKLWSTKQLTQFTALTDQIILPPEYNKVLNYSLSIDLANEKNVDVPQNIINIAVGGQGNIKDLNSGTVSWAEFDTTLTRNIRR